MLIISLCFFRKESAAVIVALFELNTPEFSMMLTVLPKSFQVMTNMLLWYNRPFFCTFFPLRNLHTTQHVYQHLVDILFVISNFLRL